MSRLAWMAVLAAAVAGFVYWCIVVVSPPAPQSAAAIPSAFETESGPEEIGLSRLRVIRHKASGRRFIYAERNSGGIFLTPLNP